MKLKCKSKKCGYEWDYKGESIFYASCPRCKGSVRINKEEDGKSTNE